MLNIIKNALLAMLLVMMSNSLLATQSATAQLQAFVSDVLTFQADFEQTVRDSMGRITEQAQGEFLLQRPGQFKWDYQQPFPQKIVADGQRIWFYDMDLEQVTVKQQSQALADTPASLLSGKSKPEDQYNLVELPAENGLKRVKLTPKQADPSFQEIVLSFDNNGLKDMLMKDNFDQQTHLKFSNIKTNPVLPINTFVFDIPKGVDVIGGLD